MTLAFFYFFTIFLIIEGIPKRRNAELTIPS